MPVAAHAHGIEGIRRAVEAGVTTLEHCSFVTETNERRFNETLAAMIAERGIFVCPTANVNAPYVAQLTGISVGQHIKPMHDMGVGSSRARTPASTTRRTISSSAGSSIWSRSGSPRHR